MPPYSAVIRIANRGVGDLSRLASQEHCIIKKPGKRSVISEDS